MIAMKKRSVIEELDDARGTKAGTEMVPAQTEDKDRCTNSLGCNGLVFHSFLVFSSIKRKLRHP